MIVFIQDDNRPDLVIGQFVRGGLYISIAVNRVQRTILVFEYVL